MLFHYMICSNCIPQELLEVKDLFFQREGRPILRDVSFQLRKGQILGIAGIEGNGQSALSEIIFGVHHGCT
ncbi:MAG: hypothetical protein ACFNLQ_08865, partial [Capnocytophaga ochracea]